VNDQFVTVARVVKPQGRRGEVIAELHTNVREQLAASRNMEAVDSTGKKRALEVEAHWFHKGRVVLKFRGVDSISQAEELRGADLQIPRSQLLQLEAGSYYVDDLVGCAVINRGSEVGSVAGVQFGAGEAPLLVVRGPQLKEFLVPLAQEYLVQVDVSGRRVEMALPDKLLELDAPLSEEEKRAQRTMENARSRSG
jgi:16S rRNA processing protein RimM